MLMEIDPLGVAPVQLVLLTVVAAVTTGLTWVSLMVKPVIALLQFDPVLVACT
jgi:hypothetical protein